MKKIMIFLMTIFTAAVFMPKARAIVPEENYTLYSNIEEYVGARICDPNVRMNVFKGIGVDGNVYSNNLFQELIYLNDTFESGVVSVDGLFQYGESSFHIIMDATYDVSCLIEVTYSYLDNVFYRIEVAQDCSPSVVLANELHMPDLMPSFSKECYLKSATVSYKEFEPISDVDELIKSLELNEIGFELLYGTIMSYNTVYTGKDVHVVTQASSPLPLDSLLSGVKVNDLTDGEISDYKVIATSYNHQKAPIGLYEARLACTDRYGNAVVQDVIINVVDAKAPVIKTQNKTVSYKNKLGDSEKRNGISATDDSEFTLEYDFKEYDENYNKPGSYTYKVTARDKEGNVSTATGTITVIDDVRPVIKEVPIYVDHPYKLLTDDEIKESITVIDEIDGPISKESIVLKDMDNYKENYNKLGSYSFRVSCKDKALNEAITYITIYVVDNNMPEIEISGSIAVGSGEKLTKEQIIKLLKESGQMTSEIASLRSDYFDEENPKGEYDLFIELADGSILKQKINVYNDSDIDYDEPAKKDENKSSKVTIITVTTLISAATIAGVVIFIKRKH